MNTGIEHRLPGDDVRRVMWRFAGRRDLHTLVDTARTVARHTIAPLIRAGARDAHEWTGLKARALDALEQAGLMSVILDAGESPHLALALVAWELSSVDAGAAACTFAGSLAQSIVRWFGTDEQRARYLQRAQFRYGAVCLTEPLPHAGAEAVLLSGKARVADWNPGGEPVLEIDKRGRFTSHMAFADFVIAAVGSGDKRIGNPLVVLLEPTDPGVFDRGTEERKLGHQLSSTRSPTFSLQVPASRIVGGYTIEDGAIIPRFTPREMLEPVFRGARVVVGLMTAAKVVSSIQTVQRCGSYDDPARLASIWAAGEAAASLGFAASRLCDELPPRPGRRSNPAVDVLCAASKLFSTAQAGILMREIAGLAGECGMDDFVQYKCIDAQVEAIYLGPEAIERRQVAAACVDESFLRQFRAWTAEMEQISVSRPDLGALPLATAMAAWLWTLDYLRQTTDASGRKLYADVRQSITFPMADALSWLLATRALILDVLELDPAGYFADLSFVQAARAAGEVGRICDQLVFGTRPQGAAIEDVTAFIGIRRRMDESLSGCLQAGERY